MLVPQAVASVGVCGASGDASQAVAADCSQRGPPPCPSASEAVLAPQLSGDTADQAVDHAPVLYRAVLTKRRQASTAVRDPRYFVQRLQQALHV